jgi:hypothetical protein
MEVLGRVYPFRFDVFTRRGGCLGDYHRRGGHLAEDTDDRTWEMEGIAMTESDCKLITEKLLGEEWDQSIFAGGEPNRTFQDPQDFFACFEKLVERGEWQSFTIYLYTSQECGTELYGNVIFDAEAMQWLLFRTESGHYRLCQLTAEYLKEKEKNNG